LYADFIVISLSLTPSGTLNFSKELGYIKRAKVSLEIFLPAS